MTTAPRLCFDRILPGELALPRPSLAQGPNRAPRAISPIGKQWPVGSQISFAFLGGTAAQRKIVKDVARLWVRHVNLNFVPSTSMTANVRIAFDERDGSWSYIGSDALHVPAPFPTINFGWLDKAVILHEFGHALSLAHSHQNPKGGIVWNEANVIKDLSGPPNYWDTETIRHNVLEKYSLDQIIGTDFDPDSIMLYAFPASWTVGGSGTKFNEELSAKDKAFVGSAGMYPKGAT